MDLNHIQLPGSLVQDLYKNHLIDSAPGKSTALTKPVADIPGTSKRIQFLGENKKGVCLLVSYENDVYLPDEQLHFLTSILQACKLNLGDVAIINCNRENIMFASLREQLTCHYLLTFNVAASAIGLGDNGFFNCQSVDGCKVMFAPAAEQLNSSSQESKLLKSKLWNCLKQIFAV